MLTTPRTFSRTAIDRWCAESTRALEPSCNGLLDDLSAANVRELVLESRQDHNDARDRRVIGSRSQRGDAGLDYRHEGPRQEPLLWLADALAGAVMSQIRKDGRFVAALPAERLTIRAV